MKCAKNNCQSIATYGNYCYIHRGRKGGETVGISNASYNLIINDEDKVIRSRRISSEKFNKFSLNINSIKSFRNEEYKKPIKVVIIRDGELELHYKIVEELSNSEVIYIKKQRVLKRNAG